MRIARHRAICQAPFCKIFSCGRCSPFRGNFFQKFLVGGFSGEFSCIFSVFFQCIRQQLQQQARPSRPGSIPPAPPPGSYTHTRQQRTPGRHQPRRHTRQQLHRQQAQPSRPPQRSRRSGPGIVPGRSSGSRSHSPGRPGTYTHTRTRQQANAAHTQEHRQHTRPPHPTEARHQAGPAAYPRPPPILPQPTPQHQQTKPNQQPTEQNARDSTKRARARITHAHPRGGSKRARA